MDTASNRRARWGPWTVLLCVAASIAAAFAGSGALGGRPIKDAAGGWLSADGTPLAPGTGAFAIWTLIYAGLAAYAVWQALPAQLNSDRQAALRPWAAASAALNGLWIWVVQAGWLGASVLVIVLLLAVLARILVLLNRWPAGNGIERAVADGTFGLYLGWVTVATLANAAAWLGSKGVGASGFDAFGLPVEVAGGALLAVTALIGVATAAFGGKRLAPAVALAWGLAWIAAGRQDGDLESVAIAWAARLAAITVLLAAVALRIGTEPDGTGSFGSGPRSTGRRSTGRRGAGHRPAPTETAR
ncbi:tryptophan-rich sensory protein [Arthrobacter ginkgonis]|uniref:Tryptophan-rich sensory protein n=1 Tax=Arthrobacter ginkgonis TaxID=1630594 RepID=A0ABP7BYQ2_9MICC